MYVILFRLLISIFSLGSIHTGHSAVYEKHLLWDRPVVVCFFDKDSELTEAEVREQKIDQFTLKPLRKRQRRKIQRIVNEQFTHEKTGIYFTGWKLCSETSSPDARIFALKYNDGFFRQVEDRFSGRATIGMGRNRGNHSSIPHVFLEDLKNSVIIHEFGHLSGLRHEHIRRDSLNDKSCWDYAARDKLFPSKKKKIQLWQSYWHKLREGEDFLDRTSVELTVYDTNSVMNYCNQNQRAQLSELDSRALKYIYRNFK